MTFSLLKTMEICFGSTKMGIFYQEKAFHAGKKIRKNYFAPSEKYACYTPGTNLTFEKLNNENILFFLTENAIHIFCWINFGTTYSEIIWPFHSGSHVLTSSMRVFSAAPKFANFEKNNFTNSTCHSHIQIQNKNIFK